MKTIIQPLPKHQLNRKVYFFFIKKFIDVFAEKLTHISLEVTCIGEQIFF